MSKEVEVIDYIPDYAQQTSYAGQQSDEVNADLMREERIANLISQLNPDSLMEEIEYRLKGYKMNRRKGQWEKIVLEGKEVPPILISNFLSFLSSVLTNNTTFSNLSGNDINRLMNIIIEWVVDDLSTNAKIYGLERNYSERTRILMIVCGTCFLVFKRAENGTEARRFFSALKVQETMTQQQPQKKSFMDHLKFWS